MTTETNKKPNKHELLKQTIQTKLKELSHMENTQNTGLYTVYDILAEECGPIFEAKNEAVARRAFTRMFMDHKVVNITDYQLLQVGEINKSNGEIQPYLTKIEIEYGNTEDKEQ